MMAMIGTVTSCMGHCPESAFSCIALYYTAHATVFSFSILSAATANRCVRLCCLCCLCYCCCCANMVVDVMPRKGFVCFAPKTTQFWQLRSASHSSIWIADSGLNLPHIVFAYLHTLSGYGDQARLLHTEAPRTKGMCEGNSTVLACREPCCLTMALIWTVGPVCWGTRLG